MVIFLLALTNGHSRLRITTRSLVIHAAKRAIKPAGDPYAKRYPLGQATPSRIAFVQLGCAPRCGQALSVGAGSLLRFTAE